MTLDQFKNYKIKAIDVVTTVIAFIVFLIVSFCLFTNLNTAKSSSKILSIAWTIISVIGLILQAFMMVYQLCKIRTVSSILIAIDNVDLKVAAPHIPLE